MLHRTTASPVWEENFNTSPKYLTELFTQMKSMGFNFVSLDELIYSESLKGNLNAAVVCDDGFLDNYTEGLTVFKAMHIPFTIFLSSGFVNREYVSLEAIAEYMRQNKKWRFSPYKSGLMFTNNADDFTGTIDMIRNATTLERIQELKLLFLRENDTDLKDFMNMLYLDKDHIKILLNEPLCSFGAHGHHHAPLNRMTNKELIYHTKLCKQIIEEITNQQIDHFAYPFGGVNDNFYREFNAVKKAGFKTGFMFFQQCITTTAIKHPYMLPRIHVNSEYLAVNNAKIFKKILD